VGFVYCLLVFSCAVGLWPRPDSVHAQKVKAFRRQVFEYLDYREFLADYYAHHKRYEYGFSYRVFSRRAQCRSTNYPCLVIAGKRNLSRDMAMRFAEACGLSGSDAGYFTDLAAFNQARTQREKEHWYGCLTRFKQFRRLHRITESQAAYFSKWYIPATRELAARGDFQADPKWIAGALEPNITLTQAKTALKTLLALGFMTQDEDGIITRSQHLVTSGGPMGHHLVNYHRAMLERASAAIETIPREEREIASLTLCVSEKRLQELKQRIRTFRQELLQTAERDDTPERVVQLNFQLFPLSKSQP
jgi:uncharacterized protein (TIGR02147 family)